MSLAGSSFVAMSVPGQLADNPRSRLLMQGTAQATVSPNKFSRAKTAAAREDKDVGRVGIVSRLGRSVQLFPDQPELDFDRAKNPGREVEDDREEKNANPQRPKRVVMDEREPADDGGVFGKT